MHNLVAAKGKKLIIIMIPDDYQVNTYPSYAKYQNLPLLPSARRSINNEFAAFFDQEGIQYIDLLPVFMEQAKQQLYIPEDGHWNTNGHAFTAHIITKELAKILEQKQ
jgi:hypothetical protein